MTNVIPFRSTSVKAHSRSKPGRSPAYHRKHDELGAEVKAMFDAMRATERAMEEFAEEFPGDTWRDESFILTMGLPV